MFPCPGFPPFFAAPLPPALLFVGAGGTLIFFGAGSSSEKDSQTQSSLVTTTHALVRTGCEYIDTTELELT